MQGLLLVDKPTDWTSFDAVNYVRRIVAKAEDKKPKHCKVGHCGTLDPFATGLLILLVGKNYTRRAAEFSKLDKTYEMTMHLGQTSSTGDPEGDILDTSDVVPTLADLEIAIAGFRGQIDQIPPMYSAIKIDGQRAYKLAREGKEVTIPSRPVTIKRLEIVDYSYPEVRLVAEVTSGTYIRSLVADIGEVLRTGAYTAQLRRTKIATFDVHESVAPQTDDILARLFTIE
jgi:tRNA pseudouridine55 synthase